VPDRSASVCHDCTNRVSYLVRAANAFAVFPLPRWHLGHSMGKVPFLNVCFRFEAIKREQPNVARFLLHFRSLHHFQAFTQRLGFEAGHELQFKITNVGFGFTFTGTALRLLALKVPAHRRQLRVKGARDFRLSSEESVIERDHGLLLCATTEHACGKSAKSESACCPLRHRLYRLPALLTGYGGGGGSLLRTGGPFLWCHGFKGTFPADLATDLPALRTLLTEVLQNFGRELLLRHEPILKRVLAESNISLCLIGGIRYNQSMKAIGYVRVSTEKQADFGVSLEAQSEKVRAMAVVQDAELAEVIIDAGESAKSLNRPGMARLLSLVDSGAVDIVIIAKLDRLTRSVKDLAELLERFTRRGVSLVSVAESLDTGTAAGRLVLNIMTAVSQWEREAIGERTRDAMHHKRANGEEELNRQGFTTRRGTAWRFQYVAETLRAA